jgi:hypothetical protein
MPAGLGSGRFSPEPSASIVVSHGICPSHMGCTGASRPWEPLPVRPGPAELWREKKFCCMYLALGASSHESHDMLCFLVSMWLCSRHDVPLT